MTNVHITREDTQETTMLAAAVSTTGGLPMDKRARGVEAKATASC